MMTQAFQLTRTGSADHAFTLSKVELPSLQAHEVMIEVDAFGLNYADTMIRRGLHSEKPKLPCVLGYEVVGTIIQVGKEVDAHLIGTRVVALTLLGAYARQVIADSDRVFSIGDMNPNAALALALQGITACYISRYIAPIRANETVLIHAAAGGVGTLLIQLAKQAGATVIAKVSSEEKRQTCLKLGADYAINYKTQDYVREVEKRIGTSNLDTSFNPLGGASFKQDPRLLGAGSKLVLFGGAELMSGGFSALSKLKFIMQMGFIIPIFYSINAKSLIGVNILQLVTTKPHIIRECFAQLMQLYQQGIVNPQNGGDFHFTELAHANSLLESGKSSGKLAVYWQTPPAAETFSFEESAS